MERKELTYPFVVGKFGRQQVGVKYDLFNMDRRGWQCISTIGEQHLRSSLTHTINRVRTARRMQPNQVTYVKRKDDGPNQRVDAAGRKTPYGIDHAPYNQDPDACKKDAAQEAEVDFAVVR